MNGKELVQRVRQEIEKRKLPLAADTFAQFVTLMQEQSITSVTANIRNMPIITAPPRVGYSPRPEDIWEEYVITYQGQAATGRQVEYREHYGEAAAISFAHTQKEHRRAELTDQCIVTALHRFRRLQQQSTMRSFLLLQEGVPVSESTLQEMKERKNITPFPILD